jgi:hypothetical protein
MNHKYRNPPLGSNDMLATNVVVSLRGSNLEHPSHRCGREPSGQHPPCPGSVRADLRELLPVPASPRLWEDISKRARCCRSWLSSPRGTRWPSMGPVCIGLRLSHTITRPGSCLRKYLLWRSLTNASTLSHSCCTRQRPVSRGMYTGHRKAGSAEHQQKSHTAQPVSRNVPATQ